MSGLDGHRGVVEAEAVTRGREAVRLDACLEHGDALLVAQARHPNVVCAGDSQRENGVRTVVFADDVRRDSDRRVAVAILARIRKSLMGDETQHIDIDVNLFYAGEIAVEADQLLHLSAQIRPDRH